MEKLFVTYKHAKDLKQLGFNTNCFSWFENDKFFSNPTGIFYFNHSLRGKNFHSAPTWQQAFDWLSEKYNLSILYKKNASSYYWSVKKINTKDKIKAYSGFEETVYLAKTKCLNKVLKIISN